ncbi:MAG: hypothetical protein ACJ74J_02640 [Blastocatellia bacterium]
MSKQTAASLFIYPLSEATSTELYQAMLRGIGSYQQLGERLIQQAEQAHAFRQFHKVGEYGQILSNIPIRNHQAAGHYFLAVAANSKGSGNPDEARRLFEIAIRIAPDGYKVKALLSLGALAFHKRDFDSALYYYQETVRFGKLSAASLHAIKAMSVIKAIECNHTQALNDLEAILPIIKYAPAHIYLDILNSYAVELGEVGRKDEARNIMRRVLASPFIQAYPEWRETAEDLRPSRRSFVALGSSPYNILTLPERELSGHPAAQPKPARVLSLARWKKQMAKKDKEKAEREKEIAKELENMTAPDLGFKLLEIITKNRPGYEQMRAILNFALRLFSEPSQPAPDKPAS